MRFVSVRELRGNSAEIWQRLTKERELVITSNGKPIAILSPTSEETLEESLDAIRTARAAAAVEAMQMKSLQKGLDRMSPEEVDAEIKSVRKTRSQ